MVRTKIEINVSALGRRHKTMSMVIGSNTTAVNVLQKVLEKFRVQEPVAKYQLVAVGKDAAAGSQGRVLQDTDTPSHLLTQSRTPIQFVLQTLHHTSPPVRQTSSTPSTKSTTHLIRVHYQLEKGVQGFTSLIVSPEMTARDVLQRALSNTSPSESADGYDLFLATPKGDIRIGSAEHPHTMKYNSSQLEMRKKPVLPTPPTSPPPSLSPPPTNSTFRIPDRTRHESLPDLSLTQLLKGKLRLHGELIDALRELATQSSIGELSESPNIRSRETVLEQALVEQNQILDMMQELVRTLESENKGYRESLTTQNREIQALSGWEAKARHTERELAETRKKFLRSPEVTAEQIAKLKKQLEEKNSTILSLQSRLRNETGSLESSLMVKLSAARTKLEIERVHCIELEEEVAQVKEEMSRLKRKNDDNTSAMISKESKILHLEHEMGILRNFEQDQQELIMKQRASLANKDIQLSSLTQALKKEKKVADQLRRIQLKTFSSFSSIPRIGDSSSSGGSMEPDSPVPMSSLFEQVSGREICTVELTRLAEEVELGFSFSKVELPVSSRAPCLVVKTVQEGSMAAGLLCPGDELIEVNGIVCRSARQSRAIRVLEHGVGVIKIVLARDANPSMPQFVSHSTPIRRSDSSERTAMWASAVSPKGTTFQSFSVESVISDVDESNKLEYVTVPESYALSVTKDSQESLSAQGDLSDTADQKMVTAEQLSSCSKSSMNETESLATASSSREVTSRKKLQGEIVELQDQLDESEHIRLNLESQLDSTQEDAEQLRKEYDSTKAENEELHHQLSTYETEMTEIREHISALQTALMTLEAQLTDEQQKLSSMENLNRKISSELSVARDKTSHAVGVREGLEGEICLLRDDIELREAQAKEIQDELQEMRMENTRLSSSTSRMSAEIDTLRGSLENCKRSSEETITNLEQERKQLQTQLDMAKEISEKSVMSSQEEYQHLSSQLKSAKSLLMEAERKESQHKVEIRYMKQAADLTNSQLRKMEADYQKAREELKLFKQQTEEMTVEMETTNVYLSNTQMALESKQQLVTRLQGDTDSLRRSSSKLRNENTHLKETVQKLELELKAASFEEKRLEEKLEASTREKDDMFKRLETSFEESTELSATVETLTSRVKEMEEAGQVQAETGSKEQELLQDELVSSLKLSEAKLQHELEVSVKKVELMTQQSARAKEEMKALEGKYEATNKDLNQARVENEQLAASKAELHEQLAKLRDEDTKLEEETQALRVEVDELKFKLLQVQEEAKIREQHMEESKKKQSELDSELKAATEKQQQSENMVASLEFIQTQDQGKLEQLRQATDSKEREVQQLNDQIEELNALVQKGKVEKTSLVTSNTSLKQQLEESQKTHSEAMKDSREQLATAQKKLTRTSEEFKAQEALSTMLQSEIKQLRETLEETRGEKDTVENSANQTGKERDALQAENKQLKSQVSNLKLEIIQLTSSTDSLSSECADIRQQLRQSQKEADQLTAQLHAVEMNLDVTSRALKEVERVGVVTAEELENLQVKYKDIQLQLAELNEKFEAKSMETFEKEDKITKLEAALELRQNECSQLQESLITVQASSQKRISELESEKTQLESKIAQLSDANKDTHNSLEKLKQEKDEEFQQHVSEMEQCRQVIQGLQLEKEAHTEEISGLKIARQEAESSLNQLLSDQQKMKESIAKLGDEKDVEIVKLQGELSDLKLELNTATGNLRASSENEETLKREISRIEQNTTKLQEQLQQEAKVNSELKEQVEMHKNTENEITELNEKVTALSETLKEKTLRLSEAGDTKASMESQLQSMKSENETLLEKALELSEVKVSMEELVKDQEKLKKELEEKSSTLKQTLQERDQFLATVRQLEVRNHTMKSEPVAAPPVATDNDKDSRAELLQALARKEEEISRTRDYTDKLLINVMMNAPSLLEKL